MKCERSPSLYRVWCSCSGWFITSPQCLILWLDCDREGENIAYEVLEVCQRANRHLRVFRARFSAITPQDIHHAMATLGNPSPLLSEAVEARQEIDLRLGVAFTRYQTLLVQRNFRNLGSLLVSYGPCQFPTLGFVVDRYERVANFVPEDFWTLELWLRMGETTQWETAATSTATLRHRVPPSGSRSGSETTSDNVGLDDPDNDGEPEEERSSTDVVRLQWSRERLFDRVSTCILAEMVSEAAAAGSTVIRDVNERPTRKWKPRPLTTVRRLLIG